MHNTCGKIVQFLRTDSWTSSARVSPGYVDERPQSTIASAEVPFIHLLFPHFPLHISTLKFAKLPLSEYIFYPVSTAPTISNHQRKI